MTTPPNAHRRLLAEIFADAEDHHLGTWTPTFHAAPGKIDQACAFVDTRAVLLAEKRLTPTTTLPDLGDVVDDELLALYNAVTAATAELLLPGVSVSHQEIGLAAWNRLSIDQRRNSLGTLLGCYTTRILDEEREKAHQEIADSDIDTCLDQHDETSLWDAVCDAEDDETTVDKQALINALSELDLLRRRTTPTEAAP